MPAQNFLRLSWVAACLSLSVARAGAMNFDLVPFGDPGKCGQKCPEVVSATGEITTETPKQFFDFVRRNMGDGRLRAVIFLHSPGGSVAASMRLGVMFRKTGVAAVVARVATVGGGLNAPGVAIPGGSCYSACVYAFMGAKKRVVPPSSRIGIHRMSFDETERDLSTLDYKRVHRFGSSEFVGQLSDYAHSMGVSRDLITTAERISPEDIHIVTPNELRRWNLGGPKF